MHPGGIASTACCPAAIFACSRGWVRRPGRTWPRSRAKSAAPEIGQTLQVGELNLHPGHRVHGRVFFSDAHRPDGVLAVLERSGGEDVQERPLDADGAFAFEGVPSESVVLWFRTAEANLVPGYRLSPQSYSLDYLMRAALCGRVDDDLQLAVLFEPGAAAAYVSSDYHRRRRLAPQDTRHSDQQRIESSPLAGCRTK